MDDWLARRGRTRAAITEVLSNADLVGHILRGHIGPSTLVAASAVSKVFLQACNDDTAAALFTGGLTKGRLIVLFALTNREADALPRSQLSRRGGGFFYLCEGLAAN